MGESAKDRRERLTVVVDGQGGRKIITPPDANGEVHTVQPPPGRTMEDLAAEAGEQEYLIMPVITGSKAGLDGRVGGRAVTTSDLRFRGGPLMMAGQFPEGARVRVVMEFEITDVNFPLVKHSGHVVGKKRSHLGELVGYTQVTSEGTLTDLARRLNTPDTSGNTD